MNDDRWSPVPSWARRTISRAAEDVPSAGPIEEDQDAMRAAHRKRIAAAAKRVRAAWAAMDGRFFRSLRLRAEQESQVDAERICAMVLESALVWWSRESLDPVKCARDAAQRLAEAEQAVLKTSKRLIEQLELYGASREKALDAGVSVEDPPWRGESSETLCTVRSIFFLSQIWLPDPKRDHAGSDPSGEEPLLRLFMGRLERIGSDLGCPPTSGPLRWLGPDRITTLLQTIKGSTVRPSRDAVKNARRAVLARAGFHFQPLGGEAPADS